MAGALMLAAGDARVVALREAWGWYRAADAAFDALVALAQELPFEDSCSAGMHEQVIDAYAERDRAFSAWLAAVDDAAWEARTPLAPPERA